MALTQSGCRTATEVLSPDRDPQECFTPSVQRGLSSRVNSSQQSGVESKEVLRVLLLLLLFNRMSSSEIKRASHCENKCFREKRNISHQGVRNRWLWSSRHTRPELWVCSSGLLREQSQGRGAPGIPSPSPLPTEGQLLQDLNCYQ